MSGDGINYGINSGLSRGQFIVHLFSNQSVGKLTDDELAETMHAEFPSSTASYRNYINLYRNKYNRGEWPSQVEAPPLIPEYDEEGKHKIHRTGPVPRMPNEEPEVRDYES